jgi:hypothetical protein
VSVHLQIDPEALRPLITVVVELTLARLDEVRAAMPDKLAFGEAEAARLLSLNSHQLRDERLRGRVEASVGPGKKILYTRKQLLAYLATRRWTAAGGHENG